MYSGGRFASAGSLLLSIILTCSPYGVWGVNPPDFTYQVQNYPNVIDSKEQCLPLNGNYVHQNTFVCDPFRLLTVDQINRLNTLLQDDYGRDGSQCSMTNPNPLIGVALVNRLKVGNESPDRLLDYASIFAYYLFRQWNLPFICQTGSDKMIIFYSKDDGVLYTFGGDLIQRKISSQQLIDIAVQSRAYFSNGIYEGLAYLIQQYKNSISTGRTDLFGNT
ncbi:hypothetical protein FBUS_04815 [Fasciolopsis buskii]|uniref:TPM domain-containing protein n=1 Tax=Fasciolopsis buskii TaxID=27845 RepID=A0A8E0VGJ9_9TREM|nr:hypothetical protein FBUS_04815 [Fasciolopsis buski]